MSRLTFLITIITLTCTVVILASGVKSQNLKEVRISVNTKNMVLKEILTDLEKKSGFSFVYAPEVGNISNIRLTSTKSTLYDVLKEIAQQKRLVFNQENSLIAVFKAPAVQQPGRISGKIVDDKGEPLPGASIRIIELNKSIQSSVDGTYQFSVEPGMYTIEVSYISFQTKRIADIMVKEDGLTKLDIVLNPASNALSEVVVKSTFKKESAAGLYAQQKNNAAITDGISAEQIARTPDNNLGQVLKRVSGISTIDTRYVVVRGMTERYNQAMLDGVIIPSTDMNRRNFSFDVVPAELVGSVVVNKTATPELSAEFSGGQILINTMDIPEQNFTSLTVGTGYNSRTTGKNFVHLGKITGKDYLGFDDGRRKLPVVQSWVQKSGDQTLPAFAIPQSKLFNSDQLKAYTYTARPNQNYRFSIGRVYDLQEKFKLGFSGGLTYRNTQETNPFQTIRNSGYAIGNAGGPEPIDSANLKGAGNLHKFNTTLGGVLNAGVQGEKFKVFSKNYYSRVFNETTQDGIRVDQDFNRRFVEFIAVPEVTSVYQSKLEGENVIGNKGTKFNWSGAVTNIKQQIMDMRRLRYAKTATLLGVDYYDSPQANGFSDANGAYDYRLSTHLNETDYNWSTGLSQPFEFLKDKSMIKAGYAGWYKKRSLGSTRVNITQWEQGIDNRISGRYEDIMAAGRIGATADSAFYYADSRNNGTQFNGTAKYHAAYLMLDQRFLKKLRLVYGIRAENFNLANNQELFKQSVESGVNDNFNKVDPFITGEKNWRFLPSANLTYSLNDQMNVRAAYSTTMVRPDFRETSYFELYDAYMEAFISGWNVVSTKIKNYDLRYEWYPAVGEIVSVSAFYKDFDRPLELVAQNVTGGSNRTRYLRFQNQKRAINKGFEVEFRKSLGFIADKKWLRDLTVFGNGTWMESEVEAVNYRVVAENGGTAFRLAEEPVMGVKRLLYGQSPWIVNAGLSYNSKFIGATVNYNRSAYRSYVVAVLPNDIEYENGRNLLDLQLSTRLLKQRAEIKLNISNLLDEYTVFYHNTTGYDGLGEAGSPFVRLDGTDTYEKNKGDRTTYRIKNGRTANLTFSYKF